MTHVLKKALNLLVGVEPGAGVNLSIPSLSSSKKHSKTLKKLTERELIQLESQVGAELFGAVPNGHRREFFNLDPSTWIWYDEWVDKASGTHGSMTIRYEIHENGILKVQEGARYDFIEGQELQNFIAAVQLYHERVSRQIYHKEPTHNPQTLHTV